MFLEVFFASESRARASVAVWERTEKRLLCSLVHLVHLPLVAKEATGIREALYQLTARLSTSIRAFVTVHMLVPLARPTEGFCFVLAFGMNAGDLTDSVAGRGAVATDSRSLGVRLRTCAGGGR